MKKCASPHSRSNPKPKVVFAGILNMKIVSSPIAGLEADRKVR
jgi:hypothetical protein